MAIAELSNLPRPPPPLLTDPASVFSSRPPKKRFGRTVDLRSSFPTPQGPTPLMVFRGEARPPRRLHPLELALLVVSAAQICFLPWTLGGLLMVPWPLWTSLGLGAAGLVLALWPRHYTEEHAREGEFKLVMWPKLVRFPIFWLGLVLLLYMTVQALNPAWKYVNTGLQWNMVALPPADYITWLPTSMQAPMTPSAPAYTWECMNAWRMILIYTGPWLMVCALWVGITRRVTLLALLTAIVLNGALLALIGILEKVTDTRKILWIKDAGRASYYFVSTFTYKNHAGAFFNLIIAAACALALWHFTRGDRRTGRANPAPLFALCATVAGMIVLLSNSRAATIFLMIFMLAGLIGGGIWLARGDSASTNRAVIGLLAVVFLLFLGGGVMALNYDEKIYAGLERLTTTDRVLSVDSRRIAANATWEMAQDRLLTGWGAGSFRYYFPVYERNYSIWYQTNNRWEYAHNDYLQILAELGLIGLLTVAAGTACWLFKLVRHGAHTRPHSLVLVAGLLLLMVHAWVDLPLYCPAILLTWCVLWVIAARWAEFEDNRVRD